MNAALLKTAVINWMMDDEPMDNVTAASEPHRNNESLVSSSDLEQSESEWISF